MDRHAIMKPAFGDIPGSPEQILVNSDYYRAAFRNIVRIVNVQAVLILILVIFFAVYVKTAKKQDRFFAEAMEGRKMQIIGLDMPNMGKTALTNWVAQAATQIMTFGFNDIDERFTISQANFTSRGWESFSEAMLRSGLIDRVTKTQQLITAVPVTTPDLIREGLIGGTYSWVFEMKMLVTFRSGGVQLASTKNVRVVLEQVPTRDNPNGVGIREWSIY